MGTQDPLAIGSRVSNLLRDSISVESVAQDIEDLSTDNVNLKLFLFSLVESLPDIDASH